MFISEVIPPLLKGTSEIWGNVSLFLFRCPKRSSGGVRGLRASLVERFLHNIKNPTISRAQLVFLILQRERSWVFLAVFAAAPWRCRGLLQAGESRSAGAVRCGRGSRLPLAVPTARLH